MKGVDGGKMMIEKIEFDISPNDQELVIEITNGGDGAGCDHSDLGDAKLLTPAALAVDARGKATTTWGTLKSRI